MGLKFINLTDAATSTFRVGDTVAVGVVIKSAIATRSFGLATYLDFDTADYQLLSARRNPAPAEDGERDVFDVSSQIGDAIFDGIGNVNTYSEATTNSVKTGKLDLDLIGRLPTLGAFLDANQEISVATATFRVKRNEASGSGKFEIKLRDSAAGDNRASVVAGGDDVEGMNIMSGPMTEASRDGKPTMVRTHAELIAVAPTLSTNAPIRVGDVVPVDIVLRAPAGEYIRHVNAIQATIKVASPTFRVTTADGLAINANAAAIWQSTSTPRLDIGASATGTFSLTASGNPQVVLDLTGTNPPTLTPGQSAVVGRMYVQAMRKADSIQSITVSMAGDNLIGERLNGTIAFAPMVVASPPNITPETTQCTDTCALLPLGAVRGTTGVSLKVRSPLASTPLVTAQTPEFAFATDTFRPFLGVEGRYIDVSVIVDAASSAANSREADRFDIDLKYDQSVFTSEQPEFTLATGFALRSGGSPVVLNSTIQLRLDSMGAIKQSTEVGRVRLQLKNPSGTPTSSDTIRVNPGANASTDCSGAFTGTRLWSSTTPFCDIYADYAQDASTRVGEFDRNAYVVNQPAASLQIGARLQGRRSTDPNTRFVQPIDVKLLATGTFNAAPRLLTPADHAWNFVPKDPNYSFRTATASATFAVAEGTRCDNPWRPQGTVSNVLLATATFASGDVSPDTASPCAINSIEPGTYDVYVKGQSSVGVLVTNVPFLPGQFRTISDLVLREGDIDQGNGGSDKVDNADFTAFSAAYNSYPAGDGSQPASNWNPRADLNQSGYIDVLDFSLLASNYAATLATYDSPTVTASSISPTAVRVASVSTRSTSPNANLWVRTDATDIKVGDIVPVTVGVTTGTRAIDGAQVVLRTGSGVQLVDRDGNPVTSANALEVATGGALPSLLHRALDAGRGLIELAFGRQVTPSISGVSGEASLGTVYVKVTGATSGDLVTIERQNGQFATLVAGDGDDLTGILVGLSTTDAVNAPVDLAPASGVGAPVIGGSGGVAFVAPAPSANASRAAAPTRSAASVTSASVRPSVATSRALTEDRATGTLTLSVPGRAPLELKTGTLAMAPDQFCPVLRHQTYIRLQDVGIAGATFGVEPGGVLSWVSPDQAGCVNWTAISDGGLTFTKETIMQFQLARAVPGALLWVLDGGRNGELYEVDATGTANYVTAEAFAANQDHFREVWANVIPVSTAQVEGLAARGAVTR